LIFEQIQISNLKFQISNKMNLDLKNKTALVCGSTQGIGKASAIELANLGANIILMARDEEKLKLTLQELDTSKGQNHNYLVADFSNTIQVKNKVIEFLMKSGPINILVNNTGGPAAGPIVDAKPEEFLATFNNHLINNHNLVQAVLEGMKNSGYGRIINIISTSVKLPLHNLGVSNTIRAAVANWAKTLSNEVAKFGITVNNVLPGATNTGRLQQIAATKSQKTGAKVDDIFSQMALEVPMGRIGEPHEIAAAVGFLASPAAAYINGINLPVDGGRTGNL
jgi:3-oxoacyl-[acyl-carrier protein] reductase